MIASGSHTPGVDLRGLGMPDFVAIRFEEPAAELKALISDYFVMDSEGPLSLNATTWMLPTGPTIRLTLTDGPIHYEAEPDVWLRRPTAGFYGPGTKACRVVTNGGVTIGITLTAAGAARLEAPDLSTLGDGFVELSALTGDAACEDLVANLRASDMGADAKPILDRFFAKVLARPHRRETAILRLQRALQDGDTTSVEHLGDKVGLPGHTLRRLALRHFGFTPRTLLARTRFMRSLMGLRQEGAMKGYGDIDVAYFDTSHFLRDCKRFLGMTAKRFLALDTAYLHVVIRARTAVLGTGNPILD